MTHGMSELMPGSGSRDEVQDALKSRLPVIIIETLKMQANYRMSTRKKINISAEFVKSISKTNRQKCAGGVDITEF